MSHENLVNPGLSVPAERSQDQFKSLAYAEGSRLPEPISKIHRGLLWLAIESTGENISERSLVLSTASTLKTSSVPYLETLAITKTAYNDLMDDRLLVLDRSGPHYMEASHKVSGTYVYSKPTRYLHLSRLGYQIATESARRALHSPQTQPNTMTRARRVYETGLATILTKNFRYKPDPDFLK